MPKFCVLGYKEVNYEKYELTHSIPLFCYIFRVVEWNPWAPWSSCTASCGGGTRYRTRQCLVMDSSIASTECSGIATENEVCNILQCREFLFEHFFFIHGKVIFSCKQRKEHWFCKNKLTNKAIDKAIKIERVASHEVMGQGLDVENQPIPVPDLRKRVLTATYGWDTSVA